MKIGFRVPSLKKRISARTSWKRYARHSLGLKAPRGYGWFTNPKKALYNRVYNRTTFGISDIFKPIKSLGNTRQSTHTQSIDSVSSVRPTSTVTPFTFSSVSFVEIVNTKGNLGKYGHLKTLFIIGSAFLIISPPIGLLIILLAVYLYWRWRSEPEYISKTKFENAKKAFKEDRYEDVINFLVDAVQADTSNLTAQYLLGTTYHLIGEYEKARSPLDNYFSQNLSDEDVAFISGLNYYKLGNFTRTIELLQKVSQSHKNYLLVIALLGDSFYQLKQFDMAIDVLNRAPLRKRNLDDLLLQIIYILGSAYADKGDKKNAIKYLSRVQTYDFDYRDTADKLKSVG